jgi:hypothetical protein
MFSLDSIALSFENERPRVVRHWAKGGWEHSIEGEFWIKWIEQTQVERAQEAPPSLMTALTVQKPGNSLPVPPVLAVLRPGQTEHEVIEGPEPPPSVNPARRSRYRDWIAFTNDGEAFVQLVEGDALYDGSRLALIDGLPKGPDRPQGATYMSGPINMVAYGDDLYRLTPGPRAELIANVPPRTGNTPWHYLRWLGDLESYLLLSEGQVWLSKDMESFVEIPSPEAITSFGAVLPDRPAAVLIGTNHLYILDLDCE